MASGRSGSEGIMAIWTGPRVVRLFSGHPCRVDAGGTQSLERSFDGSISGVGEVGATFGGLDCGNDLPPLKWSSLKYDFRMEDKINGKEEAYG